MYKHKHSTY